MLAYFNLLYCKSPEIIFGKIQILVDQITSVQIDMNTGQLDIYDLISFTSVKVFFSSFD